MKASRDTISRILFQQHFIGPAFQDTLFNTENEVREKTCSWKIMSSVMHFSALTNDTSRWRAVGIPLTLTDRYGVQGDIDLLFAMQPSPETIGNKLVFPSVVYRSFELKTAKVSRSGEVKSLKKGKFTGTMKQLEKLCSIGAQQTFLLEAFIVEAGYSNRTNNRVMPDSVRKAIAEKYDQIMRADYGYVAMAIGQVEGFSENGVGVLWPTQTIKPTITREPGGVFLDIVRSIENYIEKQHVNRARDVITYCYNCRDLTHTDRTGPYLCRSCKTSFL